MRLRSFEDNAGKYAWCALGLGILVYDVFCPESQTLSETVDRALESHRKATIASIGVTALHLANVLPPPVDPIHQGAKRIRTFVERYL